MAVTTKKLFPATSNATTTVFSPVGIQLNNQDDLDVYVTLSGGTRVLQLRQSTGSTAQSSHPQVNNTDGLYFPAVSAGTTLYNYQLSTDNNTITFNSALPQGAVVFCERRTRDADSSYTTFASGSTIRATDLNNSSTESNFTAQDGRNKALTIEGVLFNGDQPSTNFVTSSHIVDGSIVDADINASADIAGSKLANDSVTLDKLGSGALPTDITVASANIVDGTIVEADIANSAVTSNKIADNAVTTTEILNGAVTTAKIAADAIDGTKLADNAVDSEHYTDGSIDRVHLEADIIDSTKLADNAVNSEHYVDGSIDREHLEADIIDSTKLADNAVGSEHIQANAVTDSEIATGTLDNRYFTETELTNGALDGRYFTETESDARYFNVSTGDTIKDGDAFPDNDTTIATTAAINDRIIDLVDDVGGFVPIANETSFPTANPDVNNGSGTLVSIKGISSTRTPSGGTVTIANGAGTGNTVTITGCGSTVLTAGFGVIVETTTTLHTYAFHRLVPKATEVTTVAGISSNITTVANNTSNINAVAADASDIGIVAADGTDIGLVAGSISNVNTTAGSIANVNTVAGSISNVNSVASNISNVNAVNSNESNINSAVSNASNINSAVSNASNINTVAGSISNVNTTATNISSVNNVSSNISNVNNFNDKYQIAANNPTTDGGGNALAAGDLYFNTSANELKVYTGSAWQGGVTATGTFAATTGNTFTGDNRYNDGVKALFGTGSDLQISHDGSSSFIRNNTGQLVISTGGSGNSNPVKIQPNQGEESIVAHFNNKVALFFDNSSKFETTSSGVDVTGTLVTDGLTSAGGLTTNGGYLNLQGTATTKILLQSVDGNQIRYRNAAGTYVANLTSVGNGDTFRIQNEKQSQTLDIVSGGVDVSGNLSIPNDTGKLQIGASQDLELSHDGSNTLIRNNTGELVISCAGAGNSNPVKIQPNQGEDSIVAHHNERVELYYDNSKKFETTSAGVTVTGNTDISGELTVGANDLTIANNYLRFKNTGVGRFDHNVVGQNINFRTSNSSSLDTTPLILESDGDIQLPNDNAKLKIGASQDLELYHDGSHSFIRDIGTGALQLSGNRITMRNGDAASEYMFTADENGAVELYYDNSKKFETTANGIIATGNDATGNILIGDLRLKQTSGDTTYIKWDASHAKLEFIDNVYAMFGSGNDLEIFHNGNNSFIRHVGTGNLHIKPKSNEEGIVLIPDGAVELYQNNTKRLETTSSGVSVTGNFAMSGAFNGNLVPDSDSSRNLGANGTRWANVYADTLYGDGSNLTGISSVGGSTGVDFNDNVTARFGTGNDLKIYHNGTDSYIVDEGTGVLKLDTNGPAVQINKTNGERLADFHTDGSVELYYDNGRQLETRSNGIGLDNNLFMPDQKVFYIGNHNDLQLYHDGSHSYIKDGGTGQLRIQSDAFSVESANGNENQIFANENGAVNLYYDNSNKFATTSTGALVTGGLGVGLSPTFDSAHSSTYALQVSAANQCLIAAFRTQDGVSASSNGMIMGLDGNYHYLIGRESRPMHIGTNGSTQIEITTNGDFRPLSNNARDLGSTSLRWRNVYTNDLNLSNEGSSNDVDGTWGDWTVQEGESDLFLKNNRSGKKYKFNLTEVS